MNDKILIAIVAGSFTIVGVLANSLNEWLKYVLTRKRDNYIKASKCDRIFEKLCSSLITVETYKEFMSKGFGEDIDYKAFNESVNEELQLINKNMGLLETEMNNLSSRKVIDFYQDKINKLIEFQSKVRILKSNHCKPNIFVKQIMDANTDLLNKLEK